MLKKLLFETKAGDLLLGAFERWTGLAVVEVEALTGETRVRQTNEAPAYTADAPA